MSCCRHSQSVELLPGHAELWITGQTSLLLSVDGHLGVPTKVLHRSYLAAVTMFNAARKAYSMHEIEQGKSAAADLQASSSVIALANPAHQTALNARKRLIQGRLLAPAQELDFIGALMTAKHCAKEAVLWYHRRWLLQHVYGLAYDDASETSKSSANRQDTAWMDTVRSPLEILQREFNVVYHACNIYPRNYYAWSHWQFCAHALCSAPPASASADERYKWTGALVDEYLCLRRWIELHISDYSAVHHLCVLVQRLTAQSPQTSPSLEIGPSSALEHAMSLLQSYPSSESLWMYLRATALLGHLEAFDDIRSSSILSGRNVSSMGHRSLAWMLYQVDVKCMYKYHRR
jgi:protein prenyltransferase alpha subunit repeat containing protein 1